MSGWVRVLENWPKRYAGLLFLAITIIYVVGTISDAATRQFWFDEYYTADLAKLRDVPTLFSALHAGADLNPPFYHLVTRAATRLAGEGELGVRLPAVFGFWVFCACLFFFVKRTEGVACGLIAMILPVLTGAETYAREGRAYGMMLGFCGCAFVCWQRLGSSTRRRRWLLIGLALSTAGAVSTHLYGIFLAVPLAIGEFVRSMQNRKIDRAIWLSILAGFIALLFYIPFVQRGASTGQLVADPQSIWAVFDFYKSMLAPLSFAAAISAAALLIYARIVPSEPSGKIRLPAADAAAAMTGAFLTPVLIVVASLPFNLYFHPRYALISVFGLVALCASAIGAGERRRRGTAGLMLILALALFSKLEITRAVKVRQQPENLSLRLPAGVPRGVPVYVQEPFLYIQLAHGARNEAEPRYVADVELSRRIRNDYLPDKCLLQIKGWSPMDVISYRELQAGPRQVLLLYSYGHAGWLLQKLREDGAKVELAAYGGANLQSGFFWLKITQRGGNQ